MVCVADHEGGYHGHKPSLSCCRCHKTGATCVMQGSGSEGPNAPSHTMHARQHTLFHVVKPGFAPGQAALGPEGLKVLKTGSWQRDTITQPHSVSTTGSSRVARSPMEDAPCATPRTLVWLTCSEIPALLLLAMIWPSMGSTTAPCCPNNNSPRYMTQLRQSTAPIHAAATSA